MRYRHVGTWHVPAVFEKKGDMKKIMRRFASVYVAALLAISFTIAFLANNEAVAAIKTFPAGSYIIPLEPCWQPNNDPQVSPTPAYCDTHKDDHGVFHVYGMVYDLLNNNVPVYWIVNPGKSERNGIDFSVLKSGAGPAVQIIHSAVLASSGTLSQADYRGGPFVIDANDLTPEIKASAENIIRNIYRSTKVHVANYDFSAPVHKVLSGRPPKVAVLGEGANQVFLDYLKATGLGDRIYSIFRSITTKEIINGVLDEFQLLWVPHWILEKEIKVQADRDKVLSAVRSFLEKGNGGFFGCASIGSIEGSIRLRGKTLKTTGLDSQNSGGFLTDRTYSAPRVDSGGGSMSTAEMVFENPALSLGQCAGWNFVPHEGYLENLRPRMDNTPGYIQSVVPYRYNSAVARFVHDRDDYLYKAPIPVAPPGYDYFIGGRINGTATQGYAAYLAGHRYIRCSNADQPVPAERRFDLYFDRDISVAGYPIVTIEAVHSGCTRGVDCPKLSHDISNPLEDISNDGKLYLQTEGTVYDPASRRLALITVGNLTTTDRSITELIITFPTDPLGPAPDKQASLMKIMDSTAPAPGVICAPDTVSPAICSPTSPVTLGSPPNTCSVDWTNSNTCAIRYLLNTLLGLQFHLAPNEYNETSPVVDRDVLFKGTFEYPGYKGHLYGTNAIDKAILWDAGTVMPSPGTANPSAPARANDTRYVFTNIPGMNTTVNFEDGNASILRAFLDPAGTKTANWARALINSVRGRRDASEANPAGLGDVRKRLGGIESSTPAVFQRSQVIRDSQGNVKNRDRIVFVGAQDGMLHAFYAGSWDGAMNSGKGGYTHGSGQEIWAYIPSSLLSSLQHQTFTDCSPGDYITPCDPSTDPHKCTCPLFFPAVAVDGAPAIGDFFLDDDNDPRTPNVWKTVLVGTAVILAPHSGQSFNQGIVFALDVTDPYDPKILWERTYLNKVDAAASKIERNYYPLAGDYNGGHFPSSYISAENWLFDINMGNSRGVAVGRVRPGTKLNSYIFLTSNWINQVNTGTAANPHRVWGLGAYALDLRTGDIVWETKILYTGDSEGIDETPPIPALMDVDDTGTEDYMVFGDMQGRLWILRASDGKSILGDSPAFVVKDSAGLPMGAREPIGASVSVQRNYIVFGTGGRDSLTGEGVTLYHVYALRVTPEGVKSLWKDPTSGRDASIALNPGEKVWSPPIMDGGGNIYIATGQGYSDIARPDIVRNNSKGRFILADRTSGAIKGSPIALPGAVVGGIDVENKHAYVITFDGTVIQVGGNDFTPSGFEGNPIKILWWKRL